MNALRHQPSDLVEFAAQYFSDLLDNRDHTHGSLRMGALAHQDDDEMAGSDNDDFMDEAEGMKSLLYQTLGFSTVFIQTSFKFNLHLVHFI